MFGVAPVDESGLVDALALGWADYEDAVTAVAARHARCDAIVTRDPRGFVRFTLPVADAAGAVALLQQGL